MFKCLPKLYYRTVWVEFRAKPSHYKVVLTIISVLQEVVGLEMRVDKEEEREPSFYRVPPSTLLQREAQGTCTLIHFFIAAA